MLKLTITQLEHIVAVHDTGNFKVAAGLCFKSQPTLSQSINKAEGILGFAIFEMNGTKKRTTDNGEKLVCCARNAIAAMQEVEFIGESL